MKMLTIADNVLETLKSNPAVNFTNAELATAISAPKPSVGRVTRQLANAGRIVRNWTGAGMVFSAQLFAEGANSSY